MVSEARQRAMETNRSLRTIKNVSDSLLAPLCKTLANHSQELESLLEKGVITESAFDDIQALLPSESSLSAAPTPAQRNELPLPPRSSATKTPDLSNLSINNPPPGPPSYSQSTGAAAPALPTRNQQQPPAPPAKPVIAHARALYRYAASDARDCSFERDDKIEVYEYMNADWWMGRNTRTGAEGIFPKNYVEPEPAEKVLWPPAPSPGAGYPGAHGHGGSGYMPSPPPQQQQQMYGGYPPPPGGQVNPYNAHAPPMAVANDQGQQQEGGGSKFSEGGKKIGKKLGNAAIFGAGATIGSNIVNSIF